MNKAQELRQSMGVEISDPIVPEIQYRTMALEYATRSTVASSVTDPAAFLERAGEVYKFLKDGPAPVDTAEKQA